MKRKRTICSLPCDVECQRAVRNKKVADALSISDSAIAAIPTPMYTEFLKNQAKTNYKLMVDIEDTLVELVQSLDAVSYIFSKHFMKLQTLVGAALQT